MKPWRLFVAVLLLVGLAVLPAAAQPCSLDTIAGTYAWEMKGQHFEGGISAVPGPGGAPLLEGKLLPVYFTGLFTVKRSGTASGSYSGLFGMVPLGYPDPLPVTATFTVNPDCTGVVAGPNGFGGINTDSLVILDNGREIRTVSVSGAPFRWQFTMMRIGRANESVSTCGANLLRGRYAMRCEGFEVTSPGPPPVISGVLPLFVFDVAADGTLAGRHFSRDHPLEGFEVSGQMMVNADCTSQAAMQTGALPGATVIARGVFYDNGKEWFGGPILAVMNGKPIPGAFAGFGCHTTRLER